MQKKIIKLKGIFGFFVMCIVLVGVSGCQLAEAEEQKKDDTVIGVLVTTDEKEVKDYYKNHKTEIEYQAQYDNIKEERIYLKSDKSTIVNEDGEEEEEWSYTFPELNGLYSFNVHILQEKSEEESYMQTISYGEGLYQVEVDREKNNEGESAKESLDATIYINPEKMKDNTMFHLYKIYQTSDNQVYINCNIIESFQTEVGGVALKETDTIKKISNETEQILNEYSCNIHLEEVIEADQICIFQMDKENNVIKKNIYTSLNLPEKMPTEKETEFLLVEKHYKDIKEKEQIERSFYSYEEEEENQIPIYINRGDGIYMEQDIEIDWIRNRSAEG